VETSRIDEELNQWLRDAHAMEGQAETMLKAQASRIENYPELAAGAERHLAETRRQRERLEQCLVRRGTSASGM
jgi:ferritin-like metal-binding protein YciE